MDIWVYFSRNEYLILVIKSRRKGSSTLSVRSPIVDEERMMPGYWLGYVICILFSTLTLKLVGRKDIQHLKTPFYQSPEVLFLNK